MGSNPCRKLSLLGFAHLIEGSLVQVQGVYKRMTLTRGRVLEESRVVALVYSIGITCIRTLTFNICLN